MISLKSNIVGKDFARQISACFNFADTFSLTKNGWLKSCEHEKSTQLLRLLNPYHIETLHTNHWFCYYVPKGSEKEVYLFRTTPEARDIILSTYNRIFHDGVLWKEPEDLCFFKGGKLIFGSVSHENICFVYDDVLGKQLQSYGVWEQIPDEKEEQILL